MSSPEAEIITDLQQSFKTEGPIRPVLKTKFGIASGETRLKAVPSWPVVDMEKADEQRKKEAGERHATYSPKAPQTFLEFLKLKAHDNIHALKPAAWWDKIVNQAAQEYRTAGVPLGEVSGILTTDFGLTPTMVQRYLHEEFKSPVRVALGKKGGRPEKEPEMGSVAFTVKANEPKTSPVSEEDNAAPPPKREPYAKGTSPSPKEFLKSEYTHAQVTLMAALNRVHAAYTSEHYVAVEGWRCPRCGTQFYEEDIPTWKGPALGGGRYCPDDTEMLIQATERCDVFLQTRAGFAVAIEVEGAGSSSRDNPRREKLLLDQGVRTAHVSNDCAEDYADELAGLVKAFLL